MQGLGMLTTRTRPRTKALRARCGAGARLGMGEGEFGWEGCKECRREAGVSRARSQHGPYLGSMVVVARNSFRMGAKRVWKALAVKWSFQRD